MKKVTIEIDENILKFVRRGLFLVGQEMDTTTQEQENLYYQVEELYDIVSQLEDELDDNEEN